RPDLYIGYFAMAEVLRDSGQYFEAIGYLKKTVAVDPAHEPAYLELVKINQRLGNFEAVRENAVKLLEINSNNLAAYHYLALSNFERGIYELPGTYLTEEMKNNPFYPKMAVSLADILLKKRQFKKAYDLYRENIERETDSEYLLNTLAWMAATSSVEGVYNPKESLVYALEVCERDGYQQPELLDTLAAAYAANGDFSQAAETAQKAVEVATQDGNNALARQIQSRLRLFQSGKQYYDPGLRQ
ncbi:MAG: tetratricopeptide repeat protein, partial [Planctomycetota bacterium]